MPLTTAQVKILSILQTELSQSQAIVSILLSGQFTSFDGTPTAVSDSQISIAISKLKLLLATLDSAAGTL